VGCGSEGVYIVIQCSTSPAD
jgi:hypothetical protein